MDFSISFPQGRDKEVLFFLKERTKELLSVWLRRLQPHGPKWTKVGGFQVRVQQLGFHCMAVIFI
jgi:hypothetical protein